MNRVEVKRGARRRGPTDGRSGAHRPASAGRAGLWSKGEALPKAAGRLAAALAPAEAFAAPDPTDPDAVIVRSVRNGVSLGAGHFPAEAARDLVRSDLAAWSEEPGARRLHLSGPGRARLRRAAAAPDEAFRRQHGEVAEAEIARDGARETVALDASESPLAWLSRRRDRSGEPLIDAAAFEAGERLRRDLTVAAILPRVTMGWDRAAGPSGGPPRDAAGATDAAIAARQRATAALEAVGPDFADLLLDLCGFLKGLETIERERDWPPRSGKVVVRLALARLADHYGLKAIARGPDGSRAIRTWRAVVIEGGRAG
jgi:hypothetical protein